MSQWLLKLFMDGRVKEVNARVLKSQVAMLYVKGGRPRR